MDTCFPLLKLKHHCERQERERSTEEEEPEAKWAPTAGTRRRRRGEGEGEGRGRPRSPPEPRQPHSPRRPSARRIHTWVCDRGRGGGPSSQSSPFLCFFFFFSFIERGLRFSRKQLCISVLSRLLAGGGRARRAQGGAGSVHASQLPDRPPRPHCLCSKKVFI